MSYKTRDGKTHQSTVLMGDNGLPIDGIATIAGSYVFLESDTEALMYSAGGATVTLPVGSDLTPVTTAKARYTGRYVLITNDNSIYYINRQSIDVGARTFTISRSDASQITPAAIDLSPGWSVAEADIVNRMATTSAAKIDSVEFRDMHFQMQLDGDPITLLNQDGEGINPATEEKQDDQIVELQLINDELDTHTIHLQELNDSINDIEARLETFDTNIGETGPNTLRTITHVYGKDPNGTLLFDPISGTVDSNSSTTPLLAGGTFTGTYVDCSRFASIGIAFNSDVGSAVNGMKVQYSNDQVSVVREFITTLDVTPNGVYISLPPEAQFFRVVYINGASNQTTFVLQTKLHESQAGSTVVPIEFPLDDFYSIVVNRSIGTGKSTDGSYVNSRAPGVSTLNSTATPLGISGTYVGTFEDVLGYTNIAVSIFTDQNSAADGLIIEHSSDGVNVDYTQLYTLVTNEGNQYSFGVLTKFFRVRYVNGAVAQTSFRLQTIYHTNAPKPSSHRIADVITGEHDAELVKSVITGKREDGLFDNAGFSNSSSIKVAVTDRPSEVRGRIHVSANIDAVSLTSSSTVIHTVTSGYTFYMTSLIVSMVNESTNFGRMVIRDGTTKKVPLIMPQFVVGTPSATNIISPSLPEPLQFTTDVNAVELLGNITACVTIVGYEEPN